jgi:hypothetical protein
MKEVKHLKQEMLTSPGWIKHTSVKIAVFAAESCVTNFHYMGGQDNCAQEAVDSLKNWLANKQKRQALGKAIEMKAFEDSVSSGCGSGGESAYFAARSVRFALEATQQRIERKAAKKAAKAIYNAALSKGWTKPVHEPMIGDDINRRAYWKELLRLRGKIQEMRVGMKY